MLDASLRLSQELIDIEHEDNLTLWTAAQ